MGSKGRPEISRFQSKSLLLLLTYRHRDPLAPYFRSTSAEFLVPKAVLVWSEREEAEAGSQPNLFSNEILEDLCPPFPPLPLQIIM